MKRPTLLEVEWEDCVLLANEWRDGEDMSVPGTPIVSVGFRIKEEDGFLFLAASFQAEDSHRHFAQPVAIPVKAIIKKKRLAR